MRRTVFLLALFLSASPAFAQDAAPGAPPETAEQVARRHEYVRASGKRVRAIVHRDGKLTPEETAIIRKHWRRVHRLLRIQSIAESAGNEKLAARAKALLEKEDLSFYRKLEAMNPKEAGR